MAVNYSKGVSQSMLALIDTDFTNCSIEIRTGTQPLSADDAATGTLLGVVSVDALPFVEGSPANGLNFDSPVDGVLSKPALVNWKYKAIASGTSRWFRLRANPVDDGLTSDTLKRIDGSIGNVSGDMTVGNLNVAVNDIGTVDSFNIETD